MEKRGVCAGLDCYLQVTSPIRRYSDMIAHRQIKAHLLNLKPPYQREELEGEVLPHLQLRYLFS